MRRDVDDESALLRFADASEVSADCRVDGGAASGSKPGPSSATVIS